MDKLLSLKVFCLVAEQKSFVAAAERLALSATMVSKHIQQLERGVGARLLNRTSRRVSLTEAGALYFEQVRQLLESLQEVEAAVGNVTTVPAGTLRLSVPVWLANQRFVDLLARFQQRYPEVRLDVDVSGRLVDVVEEGFDLVLRASARPDEGLIARPLLAIDFPLVAAPAYLQQHGPVEQAANLHRHALLWYSLASSHDVISLHGPHGKETVRLQPTLRTNNETLLHLAALAGSGLAFLPMMLIERDLTEGHLQRVLPDYQPFQVQLHAIYPSRKYLSAKVRAFIDFLVDEFTDSRCTDAR